MRAKIAAVGSLNVWFSIITVYEKLFNGLLPELNKVMNKRESVRQFDAIIALLDEIAKWQILPFTAKDYENFKDIYSVVKKAPMDCRIAGTAKTRGWIVVTHNNSDFDVIQKRTTVKVEDWSIVPPT